MDVLLDDDVAGKHAVEEPVAETPLGAGGTSGFAGSREKRTVVKKLVPKTDFAYGARADALHQLDKRRRLANLESNLKADPALGLAPPIVQHAASPR